MFNNKLFRIITPCFSLVLFILSLFTIYKNFHYYNTQNIWNSLSTVPYPNIIKAIALMSLNYILMTGYDCLAVSYVNHTISYSKKALVGIICPGISNSVGFALVSSSMIRYRLYSNWGLSITSIAKISTFCNLTFSLGLFFTGAISFIINPIKIPHSLNLPFMSVRPLGFIFLFLILGYLLFTIIYKEPVKIGQWTLPNLSPKIVLAQLIVSTLDWLLAAAVFYSILNNTVPFSYLNFLEIYMLAQVAGLVSNIPGGFGIFETVILMFLSPFIYTEKIFSFLLIYRGIYCFIPLIISIILFAKYELGEFLSKRSSVYFKKYL